MPPARTDCSCTCLFGARVRARRIDRGWTIEDLAERAGLHWTYVGQVERGRRNLSLRNVLRLAQALEVNAADLVDGLLP